MLHSCHPMTSHLLDENKQENRQNDKLLTDRKDVLFIFHIKII